MQSITRFFPALLFTLDVGAAIVYAVGRDWRQAIYWGAASVLVLCVTF